MKTSTPRRMSLSLGLLLAALALSAACGDPPKPPPPSGGNNTTDLGADMPSPGDMADMGPGDQGDMAKVNTNAIRADDQTLEDPLVAVVQQVQADAAGFVVIHADQNGQPGARLGAAAVPAGASAQVRVELNRVAVDGERLHAMLYVDEPADGRFTFDGANGQDPPARTASGDLVTDAFTVTVTATFSPSLRVEDQALTNTRELIVQRAVSRVPGWVVIRADDQGQPGAILGQTALEVGPNTDLQVLLSRDVLNGERLHATLHVDDPADGRFTYTGGAGSPDGPELNDQGQPYTTSFITTIRSGGFEPALTAEDHATSDPFEVRIKRVVSDGPGWLVVREDDMGQPGPIIGRGFIGAGESLEARAQLNREVNDGERLHVTLHADDPADGRFTFDGANGQDAPVLKNGQALTASFDVTLSIALPYELSVAPVFDLVSDLDRITIASASADGPSWVVVYEKSGANVGAQLGRALIPRGRTNDLQIMLSRELTQSEEIITRLHRDDPADGQFTHDANPLQDVVANDAQGQPLRRESFVTTPQNSLQVSSQELNDLSTKIVVTGVTLLGRPGWLVVREVGDGPVVGSKALMPGAYVNEEVFLSRPAVEGETLNISLRYDDPQDGVLDISGNNDPVVESAPTIPLEDFFSVLSIAPEAPAVRLTLAAQGSSAYRVTRVEPAAFASVASALNADNPTLTLRAGWRYAFVNMGNPAHPLELIRAGATRAQDTVLLTQTAAANGTLQADMDVQFLSQNNTIVFSLVSSAFSGMNALTGYRCSVAGHPGMRGAINVVP